MLVNEIARRARTTAATPRGVPARPQQFEQHVRAICGLPPLGDPRGSLTGRRDGQPDRHDSVAANSEPPSWPARWCSTRQQSSTSTARRTLRRPAARWATCSCSTTTPTARSRRPRRTSRSAAGVASAIGGLTPPVTPVPPRKPDDGEHQRGVDQPLDRDLPRVVPHDRRRHDRRRVDARCEVDLIGADPRRRRVLVLTDPRRPAAERRGSGGRSRSRCGAGAGRYRAAPARDTGYSGRSVVKVTRTARVASV